MNRILVLTAVIFLSLAPTMAQGQAQERGDGRNPPPGDTVFGKVTSAGKDSLTVAPLGGGDAVTVKVSDTTRVMKERQPAQLSDLKTGDVVVVRGQMNNGVLAAGMVAVLSPEMAQRIQQGGMIGFGMGRGNGGGPGVAFNREDLGKKFIAGEVKAINEPRLTIARPDGQNQDIEVDENTSFKRGKESITLPDIKVGDFVHGPGELKNGVFTPKELIVGRPQMRMMLGAPGNTSPQGNPPANKPSTQAPPKN